MPRQIHIHPLGSTRSTQTRTTVVPNTPPTTPPSPTSPYMRLAASGVTLSFRKAKKVATMSVLNRSPNR